MRSSFTFELGASVDADRSWLVPLRIEALFLAVENVVCRDGDERRICFERGSREVLRSKRIRLLRFVEIAFTTIDIGPRSTIYYGVR